MLVQIGAWLKGSPFGLASILVAIAIVCGAKIAFDLQLSTVGTDPNENHFAEALFVICVTGEIALLSGVISLLGLALALSCFVISEEKKILGAIGLSLNGAIIVLVGAMVHGVFGF
jgi:hypothetical protein